MNLTLFINGLVASSCSCILFLLAALAQGQETTLERTKVASTTLPTVSDHAEEDWLVERHKQVRKSLANTNELKKVGVVFIGDSITEGWLKAGRDYWNQSFSGNPWHVLNLGVSGDKTQNVLHRLLSARDGGMGNLDNPLIKPEVIVLMIGTNNLWANEPDEIAAGVVSCLNRLQELEPQACIILCSVLPISDSETTRNVVVPLNSTIENLHNPPAITWLNLLPHFTKEDGSLREELYTDGVHLTSQGYKAWHDLMVPTMQDVLKSRKAK